MRTGALRDPNKATVLERWLKEVDSALGDRMLPIDRALTDEWGSMSAKRPIPVFDGLLLPPRRFASDLARSLGGSNATAASCDAEHRTGIGEPPIECAEGRAMICADGQMQSVSRGQARCVLIGKARRGAKLQSGNWDDCKAGGC